ncbi:MAG TPA: type II toxin-antitoxin system Phd/YefM family antitoxin [Roseiarcus sp.]|jgi:prevent-host-death family protein|nr:type II toxin-antitoxin system Phd/YefM family antitoxin [Roseiarcus sp.]
MVRRTWSVQDAKNRFSEVVEAARRNPQTVTKYGKPAVVVIAADEYDRLSRLKQLRAPSFAEMLLAAPRRF